MESNCKHGVPITSCSENCAAKLMSVPNTSCCELTDKDGYKYIRHNYDYETGKCTKCGKAIGHQSSQPKGANSEIEKLIREVFPQGNNWIYVDYQGNSLDYVIIDGAFNLTELHDGVSKLLSEREEAAFQLGLGKDIHHEYDKGFAEGAETERERMKEKIERMMMSEFGDKDRPFYGTVAARSHAKVHNAILKKVLELFAPTHQ